MRTPFIIGILGVAVAVAAAIEWASRQSTPAASVGTYEAAAHLSTQAFPEAPVTQPATLFDTALASGAPGSTAHAGLDDGDTVLVLDGSTGGLRLNAVTLSEKMVDRIQERFSAEDAADLLCGHFLIEGHTDNLGSVEINERIGLARALAVRQFLREQFDIPIDDMRVVSYGGDRPVADNATQDGRSRNRRVVIRLLH